MRHVSTANCLSLGLASLNQPSPSTWSSVVGLQVRDGGPFCETTLRTLPPWIFRNFGDHFYTYQILLDLKVEKGMAIRTEPHPRFYTDRTDTVPIAVPALIRNWWPMMFFCVFKAPAEGRTHIFRSNEPLAQIIVIPEEASFELEKMGEEESAEANCRRDASIIAGRCYRPGPNGPPR